MPLHRELPRGAEVVASEITTPDPRQRDKVHDLVLVQIDNRFAQFGQRGVVGIVFQDLAVAVVGGIGAWVRLDGLDLGVELARLDDDVADLFRANGDLDRRFRFLDHGDPQKRSRAGSKRLLGASAPRNSHQKLN